MTEILFHHYWTSPFSEKIRVIFGMKKLAWRSVEIPNMMPKPDLMPLTGGYRKTPVMQIGADIYCDTQLIIRELDRRFPETKVVRDGGLSYGLGFWTDRPFFQATVPIIFGEIGPMVPEEFKKDREKMFPDRPFDYTMMKAASPMFRDQWRAHAAMISDSLANGKPFLGGDTPSVIDAHCHMNVWFLSGPLSTIADGLLKEFPLVSAWYARVKALGHGTYTPMDSKEALAIARAATPSPAGPADSFDPNGRKPGDRVSVMADDYGRDPVVGEIVFSNAHEIAIRRSVPEVGEVVVHFPRAGFMVIPA
jgi:glutathione S-transferase